MDHPRLIAALAEVQRHQCPCGAAAEPSGRLCRKCHARMAWRRRTTRTSRRAARRWPRARSTRAHASSLAR